MLLKHIVESGEEDDEVWQADPRAVLDRGVGEEAALPVTGVSVLPTSLSSALHQLAELTLAADKQYDAPPIRYMCGEVQGQLKVLHGLVQINNILFQSAAIQVWFHEPVSAALLMSKMHPGLEQGFDREELRHTKEVRLLE